jgi:hypothetical protein
MRIRGIEMRITCRHQNVIFAKLRGRARSPSSASHLSVETETLRSRGSCEIPWRDHCHGLLHYMMCTISLLPRRNSWHKRASNTAALCQATEKVGCSLFL